MARRVSERQGCRARRWRRVHRMTRERVPVPVLLFLLVLQRNVIHTAAVGRALSKDL